MKHAVITGGYGFIGSNFTNHILTRSPDLKVSIIDNMSYAADKANILSEVSSRVRHYRCDIRWKDTVSSAFNKIIGRDNDIDAIFHFAAESHVDNSIDSPGIFIETNI